MVDTFYQLMDRGGPMMWLLLAMSVLAVGLILDRAWFWSRTNRRGQLRLVATMQRYLAQGDHEAARTLAKEDHSVYGRVVLAMIEQGGDQAAVVQAIESQRPRLDRYMTTLSTMITAAPMLGILGTILGIIISFRAIGGAEAPGGGTIDPNVLGEGIAQALLTTASGLLIAVVVLFPYNIFRAQVNRTLDRIEALVASALSDRNAGHDSAQPLSESKSPTGTG